MARIVDFSVTIENNMPAHKNMPRPVYLEWMTHESCLAYNQGVPGDPFTTPIEFVGMLNHVGTHVDAFYHMKPGGQPIDEMPLDLFMGKAVCFDLTHIPDLGDIDVGDMEAAEKAAGVRVDGHIVLLNTGLHKRHYPRDSVMYLQPRADRSGDALAGRSRVAAARRRGAFDRSAELCRVSESPRRRAIGASPTSNGCAIWRS